MEDEVMTPEEFHEEVYRIYKKYEDDPEVSHIKFDDIMGKVLRDLGYYAGMDVIETTIRWCA